jgi:hypothetical protein
MSMPHSGFLLFGAREERKLVYSRASETRPNSEPRRGEGSFKAPNPKLQDPKKLQAPNIK